MPRSHMQGDHRGLAAAADGAYGRFGRMFEGLEGPEFNPDALFDVAETMIKPNDRGKFFNAPDDDENLRLPAGYTYFGQFVDHDLTLDKTTIGEQEADPRAVDNFRTAALDLDSIYGNGPGGDLVMYDKDFRLLLADDPALLGGVVKDAPHTRRDHRRDDTGTALIGDPRNDENVIVAQVHQAFTEFHNRIITHPDLMKGLQDEPPVNKRSDRFRKASRIARWHYQWIVVHDFLKRVTHPDIYSDIVNPSGTPRIRLYPKGNDVAAYPYMPIEFAAAAYRFGHSMVRPSYALNSIIGTQQPADRADVPDEAPRRIPIFEDGGGFGSDLRGFKPIIPGWGIDWGYFLEYGDKNAGGAPDSADPLGKGTMQPAYRIDTLLVEPLRKLVDPDHAGRLPRERSLAFLNLLRGSRLRLPTAEQVAARMGMDVFAASRFPLLKPEEIWSAGSRNAPAWNQEHPDEVVNQKRKDRMSLAAKFKDHTPLWYYILREAEWYGTWSPDDDERTPVQTWGRTDTLGGHYLGPIGSTIVLETFIGLLLADPRSYIHQPGWQPAPEITENPADFRLENLIAWALDGKVQPAPPPLVAAAAPAAAGIG